MKKYGGYHQRLIVWQDSKSIYGAGLLLLILCFGFLLGLVLGLVPWLLCWYIRG